MTKARTLADFISDGSPLADGTISVSEVSGAAPLASPTFTGTASGTFSGPLTGDVTGNVTGDLTGNVTGNLTGNVTGDVAGDIDLSAISSTISDTAVDVFVYDTSKDSDGGAWRKRTQGTSWYNETLNTAARGSRKEFPAVAVIVVDNTGQVIIYDGDDPDMPMWMLFEDYFTYTGGGIMRTTTAAGSLCVSMQNGELVVGNGRADGGLVRVRFIADDAIYYSQYSIRVALWPATVGIENRNVGGSWQDNGDTNLVIASSVVNDVAMTVLPNAPIDAATGLPVPTIALATSGGVSVIKDDGTVVDITWSAEGVVGRIAFIGDKIRIGGGSLNYVQYAERMYDIPTSDTALGAMYVDDATAVNVYLASSMYNTNIFTADMFYNGTTSNKSYAVKNAIGSSTKGLTHLSENYEDATKGMMAYATSSYNTGWMNGDIKLATLSDTDATNVTGSELVTNGTFDSDVSGWTASNATLSVVSSTLKVADNGSNSTAYQAITTTVGSTYTVSLDVVEISGAVARVLVHGSAPTAGYTGTYLLDTSSTGSYGLTFTATASTTYLQLCSESTHYVRYDNVSVRLAEEDRSVNGNGLQVFGTVTKSAVSSGADLVAYSGFSASNYLEQPYNSDLDFGTGDFCVMFWLKNTGATDRIVNRQSASAFWNIKVDASGNLAVDFFPSPNLTTTAAINLGVWQHVALVRISGVFYAYVNGVMVGSVANASNFTDTDAVLTVGRDFSGIQPLENGSLALFRISATAPTAEQIAKIYEDEKVLFQDGAQATLYGSSDAVTALAYDDTTELLHVGTSDGRSSFQGLRRVDNTTDAITAAISASNGLVAEE